MSTVETHTGGGYEKSSSATATYFTAPLLVSSAGDQGLYNSVLPKAQLNALNYDRIEQECPDSPSGRHSPSGGRIESKKEKDSITGEDITFTRALCRYCGETITRWITRK